MLKIVSETPHMICHARHIGLGLSGCDSVWHCGDCNRAIAVPKSLLGKYCSCIYCGMENGYIDIIEIRPFGGDESPFAPYIPDNANGFYIRTSV